MNKTIIGLVLAVFMLTNCRNRAQKTGELSESFTMTTKSTKLISDSVKKVKESRLEGDN